MTARVRGSVVVGGEMFRDQWDVELRQRQIPM